MLDMGNDIPLPKYLADHAAEIAQCMAAAKPAEIDKQKWINYFAGDSNLLADLDYLFRSYTDPNNSGIAKLTRPELTKLAEKALKGDRKEIRRFYLAMMMWGWEFNQLRGCDFVNRGISDPEFDNILKNAVNLVKHNELKEAYEAFSLPGCRSAYFTKLFYFLGCALKLKPLPVILDTNVVKFLHFIDKLEGTQLVSTFADATIKQGKRGLTVSIDEFADGYLKYLKAVDNWADKLGCISDDIECFMFNERDKQIQTVNSSLSTGLSLNKGGITMSNQGNLSITISAMHMAQLTKMGKLQNQPSQDIAAKLVEAALDDLFSNNISPSGTVGISGNNTTVPAPAGQPAQVKAKISDNNKPRLEIIIDKNAVNQVIGSGCPLDINTVKNNYGAELGGRKINKVWYIPVKLDIASVVYNAKLHYNLGNKHLWIIDAVNSKSQNLRNILPNAGFKPGDTVTLSVTGNSIVLR